MTELVPGLALMRKLEDVFSRIERERMAGVPILNPALRVAATGMRSSSGAWICALVTPWFINLMLLPQTPELAEAWTRAAAGSKEKHAFPAGTFEFICGAEEGLGPYRMCSLFSPVLQFECQEAALAAAEAALAALFDENLAAPQTAGRSVKETQVSRRNLLFARAQRP